MFSFLPSQFSLFFLFLKLFIYSPSFSSAGFVGDNPGMDRQCGGNICQNYLESLFEFIINVKREWNVHLRKTSNETSGTNIATRPLQH